MISSYNHGTRSVEGCSRTARETKGHAVSWRGRVVRPTARPRPSRSPRATAAAASAAAERSVGLLMEVDGGVMDIHIDGHRVAFNTAFNSLGMDCVAWAPPVYHDLLGCSDGTGEGLVRCYFQTVGWPVMLATSDRDAFVRKVHAIKQEELAKLLAKGGVPLRPDVKQVIADALSDGVAVSLLAGTQCTHAAELAAACAAQLGAEAAERCRLFTFALSPGAVDGGADEDAPPPSLSQLLAAAAGDIKQRTAIEVACTLTQPAIPRGSGSEGGGGPVAIGVDPSLMAAGGVQQRLSPAFLAALVATTGVPAGRTLAVAAGGAMLQAAAGAGLCPVAVPRKFAGQGMFPGARAKFDGYGPGLATWPRLRSLLNGSNGGGNAGK